MGVLSKCADCSSTTGGYKKHTFDMSKDHSFEKRTTPFEIKYGTGASKGTTVPGLSLPTWRQPAFGHASPPVMNSFPLTALWACRVRCCGPHHMPTIIKTIKDEKLPYQKDLTDTFSFYIGREKDDPTYMIMGGTHDVLKDDKEMHWTPTLNKNIYWEPLNDIFIHHKHASLEEDANVTQNSRHLERHSMLRAVDDRFAQMQLDPSRRVAFRDSGRDRCGRSSSHRSPSPLKGEAQQPQAEGSAAAGQEGSPRGGR